MPDDVLTFDPAPATPPDLERVRAIVELVGDHGDAAPGRLDADDRRALAALATTPEALWRPLMPELGDDDLDALIRFLTLAEAALPGWEAGEASAVIPLFGELRRRGVDVAGLRRWIRAHSDNRFLPHGSLQQRL